MLYARIPISDSYYILIQQQQSKFKTKIYMVILITLTINFHDI